MQFLKNDIRASLDLINRFIFKLPKPKQVQHLNDMKKILNIQNAENEAILKEMLKNLQYKQNFLRLTNPDIYKQIEIEKEKEAKGELNQGENATEDMADPNVKTEEASIPQEEEKVEEAESDRFKSGKYVLKDGKLVEGEAPKRKFVEFSNWYAANVDPEDLKKHKELLDRQHFRGPMWEGQPMPKSVLDEQNPLYNMDVDPEPNPALLKPKEDCFEVVKR